ncbi:Arsenate reductase [Novipirellula aureliae]|uniref:Arsenate reductase n=2 Tax=Novipirellula aureliae TaxID=2527966 RepID=A0A5C6DXY3_9BACT|nr:Arsenate reductase [Novipirellula aureliae]
MGLNALELKIIMVTISYIPRDSVLLVQRNAITTLRCRREIMTTVFHNPRCSKSRAAVEFLESRGIDFDVVKYSETPPSKKEIAKIVKMLGIKPVQLVRKGEKLFKELKLGDQELSDFQWIEIFAANPTLIERPIVVHGGRAAIGRPLENIVEILDK